MPTYTNEELIQAMYLEKLIQKAILADNAEVASWLTTQRTL